MNVWLPLALTAAVATAAPVSVSDTRLAVTVSDDGVIAVRDLAAGRLYRTAAPAKPPAIAVRRAAQAPTIDGDPADWRGVAPITIDSTMVADAKSVTGDADCSAEVRLAWDDQGLHAAVAVTDDKLTFPARPEPQWWEHDSVEIWLGARQIGFSLSDGAVLASLVAGPAEGCRTALRRGVGFPDSRVKAAYLLELSVPWALAGSTPKAGDAVRLAVGVNDADGGRREGQLYFPSVWRHSQPDTFAVARLVDEQGRPAAEQEAGPLLSGLRKDGDGLAWTVALPAGQGKTAELQVKLSLVPGGMVAVELDLADRATPIGTLAYPPPLDAAMAAGHLCLAPYAGGFLVPQSGPKWAGREFHGSGGLDMPFVGLCDLEGGDGYALILDTPYDAGVRFARLKREVGEVSVPQAVWYPQTGVFAEPRRMLLAFSDSGGYVGLARRYREVAVRQGLAVPLRAKETRRPAVARLAGAPDVWGGDLTWARQAWRRGMRRCLLNHTSTPENMKAVNDLGWLTSRYDNYVDLLAEQDPAKFNNNHGSLDEVLVKSDGKLHLGWLTWDKKTQYYTRSSAKMLAAAQGYIPGDLATHAYLGRFLDVTTASMLLEDYHPQHRQTREQDMRSRTALFGYVNSLGLVTGGEHGRHWGVSTMDYFEGMMSGGHYSWPAGHLRKPENGAEGISADYRTYGIGPVYRIPLWELVFHDCVVDYWYWGDSTDFLHALDPAITDRKDALNVLYGTPPMYWPNQHGFGRSTEAGWRRLMDSYRRTCLWHEQVMFRAMTDHRALTPDRLLHQSSFEGGYTAVVNFAAENREVTVDHQRLVLPPEGFAARGPGFLLDRRVLDDRVVMRIRARDYAFVDGGGQAINVPGLASTSECTVMVASPDSLRVYGPRREGVPIDAHYLRPSAFVADWDEAGTRVFALTEDGRRREALPVKPRDGLLALPASDELLEVATGAGTKAADLVVGRLVLDQPKPRQGGPLTVRVPVRNDGRTAVRGGRLTLTVDDTEVLGTAVLELGPGAGRTYTFPIATAGLDGPRWLAATARPPAGLAEQLEHDNRAETALVIAPDRALWPAKPLAVALVTGGEAAVDDVEVAAALKLPEGVAAQSVRVREVGGAFVPAQYEGDGTLAWVVPGRLAPGARRRFEVVGQPAGKTTVRPPSGSFWRAESRSVITPVYRLALADGVPGDLSVGALGPVISMFSYSSSVTGWVAENGRLESLETVANGPVRAVVRVRRNLAEGKTIYTKAYGFYRDRIEVVTAAEPSVTGLHSRLYYREPADYRDSRGKTTRIDGHGDDEEKVSGAPPDWVAVVGEGWAHSIVPLVKPSGLTYWDAGSWGGLGYNFGLKESRQAYVFRAGAVPDDFAAQDRARLLGGPKVSWE